MHAKGRAVSKAGNFRHFFPANSIISLVLRTMTTVTLRCSIHVGHTSTECDVSKWLVVNMKERYSKQCRGRCLIKEVEKRSLVATFDASLRRDPTAPHSSKLPITHRSCTWAIPELACKRQPWACYALYDTSGLDTARVNAINTLTSLQVRRPGQPIESIRTSWPMRTRSVQ